MLTKPTFFSSQASIRSNFITTPSPSHSFFSPNFIPKLNNTAPNLDISHIPPLNVGQSSNKRMDLSDLGNPVQKKIKYNPEVIFAPSLPSQVFQERSANYGAKPLFKKKLVEDKSSLEFNVPIINERETVKPRLLNCFEIPQNKKPVHINKVINDSLQTSEQFQQALEILKQKIVNTSTNTQQQLAKPQRPELIVKTSQIAWDVDVFNNSEVCYTESPLSTTEDSTNSCSTSDLCESERMSPLWSNFTDLEPINVMQPGFSFNAIGQEALVMKPDNLSNWGDSPKYVLASSRAEIKKTKQITSKVVESDISETPIGANHQAEIPVLCSHPGLFRPRRCLKLKWNPSSIQEDKLNEYFNRLQEMLKCTITPEKAIKLLKEGNFEPWNVYKRIQGKEKEFAREFLIRPRRRP